MSEFTEKEVTPPQYDPTKVPVQYSPLKMLEEATIESVYDPALINVPDNALHTITVTVEGRSATGRVVRREVEVQGYFIITPHMPDHQEAEGPVAEITITPTGSPP
jgi:hypothetical protein